MKMVIKAFSIVMLMAASVQVFADDADDKAWIAKCQQDNAKEGATADTVTKYCTCMNNKMSDDEKLSITAWEQKNPSEMKACEAEAGWK